MEYFPSRREQASGSDTRIIDYELVIEVVFHDLIVVHPYTSIDDDTMPGAFYGA